MRVGGNLQVRIEFIIEIGDGKMLLVQGSSAKRLRKYQFLMLAIFLLTGSFGVLLTMHWYTEPQDRR